jgi:hypothetical protein
MKIATSTSWPNRFPKLHAERCSGLWTDKDQKNAGSYFGYIDEAHDADETKRIGS